MYPKQYLFYIGGDRAARSVVDLVAPQFDFTVVGFPSVDAFLESPLPKAGSLVIAELRLPGKNGLAMQAHLSGAPESPPVIFVAVAPKTWQVVCAMRLGASDVLDLPLDADLLAARIEGAYSCTGEMADRMAQLTPREREVMRLLAEGKQTKQIAGELSISPKTVEKHRGKVLHKMSAHSVVDLVRMLLTPPHGC